MQNEIGELKVSISAQSDKLSAGFADVKKQVKNLESDIQKSSKKMSASMVAMGTIIGRLAVSAIHKFTSALSDSVQQCEQATASMSKLATVMAQRGATQAQYNEIIKLTNAEQQLGVVSASAMQNGLQELATYVAKADSLKQLTNVMNNLIVQQHGYNVSEDQALQTATMMGKVLQGQTGGMERIGYHLSEGEKKLFKYGTEEERVALLTEIVNDNLGDLNYALGRTPVGRQKQLANTWADCRAQLGSLITTIKNAFAPAISTIINGFAKAIAYVTKFLSLFGINISSGAQTATDTLDGIAGSAGDVSEELDDATESAKKLHKQLAAFDEMNVLEEHKDDSSSGSDEGLDILGGISPGAAIDWGNLIPDIELPESWKKVADAIKKFIDGFDFTKIKKALEQFAKDVNKAMKSVKKILADVWGYLEPFLHWVGNDLLPAFLNALGGAIAFLGAVIGNLWDTFLKPFIDFFLVPIAQWTGGIIVSVLNGIGDALRGMSENAYIVDVATNSLVAFGAAILGIKIVNFVTSIQELVTQLKAFSATGSLVSGIFGMLSMHANGTDVAFKLLRDSGLSTSEALETLSANGIQAGTAAASLGSIFTNLLNVVFSPATIIIEGVVAAVLALQMIMLQCKIDTMEAELAERMYISAAEEAEWASNNYSDAIRTQVELKKELEDITYSIADAELALLSAQEQLAQKQNLAETVAQRYGMTIDEAKAYVAALDLASGNLTTKDKELARAMAELESAQGKASSATEKLNKQKAEQAEKTQQLYNQEWKEVMSMKEIEIQALLTAGKYKEVSQAIQDLANHSGEFTLENGKNVQITKEDMQSMAEFIADRMADIDDDCGIRWRAIWDLAHRTVSDLSGLAPVVYSAAQSSGENFGGGVAQGIRNSQLQINNAARNAAWEANAIFNSTLDIRSPSRVMMKSGGFFSMGVAEGIAQKASEVKKEVENLSKDAISTLDIKNLDKNLQSNLSVGGVEIATKAVTSADDITAGVDLEQTPVHVTVNVGDETLISRVINGINGLSMLRNQAVINV